MREMECKNRATPASVAPEDYRYATPTQMQMYQQMLQLQMLYTGNAGAAFPVFGAGFPMGLGVFLFYWQSFALAQHGLHLLHSLGHLWLHECMIGPRGPVRAPMT